MKISLLACLRRARRILVNSGNETSSALTDDTNLTLTDESGNSLFSSGA